MKSNISFNLNYFFITVTFSTQVASAPLSLEEENIIKDIRNLFRLKREQNCPAVKDIRNLFRQEKETKAIRDRILGDFKNLFENEKEEKIVINP